MKRLEIIWPRGMLIWVTTCLRRQTGKHNTNSKVSSLLYRQMVEHNVKAASTKQSIEAVLLLHRLF